MWLFPKVHVGIINKYMQALPEVEEKIAKLEQEAAMLGASEEVSSFCWL